MFRMHFMIVFELFMLEIFYYNLKNN